MKRILCFILLLCMTSGLFSCSEEEASSKPNPNDPFYGDWVLDDNGMPVFYEFDGLGKVVITVFDISNVCAYTFDEKTITIMTKRDDETLTDVYTYQLGENTLTLNNEKETLMLVKS